MAISCKITQEFPQQSSESKPQSEDSAPGPQSYHWVGIGPVTILEPGRWWLVIMEAPLRSSAARRRLRTMRAVRMDWRTRCILDEKQAVLNHYSNRSSRRTHTTRDIPVLDVKSDIIN